MRVSAGWVIERVIEGSAQVRYSLSMTTVLDVSRLSREEKLQTMEALWVELAKDDACVESPSWHKTALRETEVRLAAGQETVLDWTQAKRDLGRLFE